MSKHLHLGVKWEDLHLLIAVAPNTVHLNGDCWEAWGEACHQERCGDAVYHALIEVRDDEHGEKIARALKERVPLVPMRWEGQAGVWATVTDAEDWSEDVFSLGGPVEDGEEAEGAEEEEDTVEILWGREYIIGRVETYNAQVPRRLLEAYNAASDEERTPAGDALDAWILEHGDLDGLDDVEQGDDRLVYADVTR